MVSSIWESITHLFDSYIAGLCVAFSIAMGIAIWAWIKSWFKSLPKPLFVLFVIIVFGLTFFSLNQCQQFRQQYGMNFAKMSNEKIQNTLMEWLDKEGWSTKSQQRPEMLFQIRAEDSFNRVIIIARLVDKDKFIVIGGVWNFDENNKTILDKLSDQDRAEMISELRIEVARFGLEYSGLKLPLNRFSIETRLPCDETITRELFTKKVVTIRNTYIIINVIIRRTMYRAGYFQDMT